MRLFLISMLFINQPLLAKTMESLTVLNLVQDDEGTKVIAQTTSNKQSVVFYLSQTNAAYESVKRTLETSKRNQSVIQVETDLQSDNLNCIIKAEVNK